MERRYFIRISLLSLFASQFAFTRNFDIDKFSTIIDKANLNNWKELPIKQLFCKVAQEFLYFPYLAGTLERNEVESCIVTFDGFDCVTFFEVSLCLSRIIKKGKSKFEDLLEEVTFTRYRNGTLTDYASRLHYSADWIYDNIRKGVVRDRTKDLGGVVVHFNVNFMSNNPNLYIGLRQNPTMVQKIKSIEKEISERQYYIIPQKNISSIESKLGDGDIIFFATNKEGLDYSHVGICLVKEGEHRLLHASSKKMKVIIDTSISKYVQQSKNIIGISIVEPLEPKY